MARTIDGIVDSHRRARELRAAGKPIWTYTVDIKTILKESDDTGIERICDAATRIAAALRAGLPAAFFDITSDDYEMVLDEAVEDMESYEAESLRGLSAEGIDPLEMFNGRLEEIYDWADRARVWLG
jgi:hypothetical protein